MHAAATTHRRTLNLNLHPCLRYIAVHAKTCCSTPHGYIYLLLLSMTSELFVYLPTTAKLLLQDPNAIESSFQTLDPRGVRGVVINRVARTLLGGLYTSHHYYAIIPTMTADNKPNSGGEETTAEAANRCVWYIVDSKSPGPEIVGGAAELATHLAMEAREHKGHVFVVSDGEGEGCIIEGGVDGGEGGESGGLEAEE